MIESLHSFFGSLPPLFSASGLLYYLPHIIVLIIVLRTLKMLVILTLNKSLALQSKPFSRSGTGEKHILILGDSTAVGTGAERSEDTIAGRLAHDFPNSEITNLAVNGGLIKDLLKQIEAVKDKTFDMVIISAGGNDIWSLSSLMTLSLSLKKTLQIAKQVSGHRVIFLLYNSIDDAPVFSKTSLLRLILMYRCDRIQQRIRGVAYVEQIPVIELFTEREGNPFVKNPKELYARDGIHPSSKGYATWYYRMWLLMTQSGFTYTDRQKSL